MGCSGSTAAQEEALKAQIANQKRDLAEATMDLEGLLREVESLHKNVVHCHKKADDGLSGQENAAPQKIGVDDLTMELSSLRTQVGEIVSELGQLKSLENKMEIGGEAPIAIDKKEDLSSQSKPKENMEECDIGQDESKIPQTAMRALGSGIEVSGEVTVSKADPEELLDSGMNTSTETEDTSQSFAVPDAIQYAFNSMYEMISFGSSKYDVAAAARIDTADVLPEERPTFTESNDVKIMAQCASLQELLHVDSEKMIDSGDISNKPNPVIEPAPAPSAPPSIPAHRLGEKYFDDDEDDVEPFELHESIIALRAAPLSPIASGRGSGMILTSKSKGSPATSQKAQRESSKRAIPTDNTTASASASASASAPVSATRSGIKLTNGIQIDEEQIVPGEITDIDAENKLAAERSPRTLSARNSEFIASKGLSLTATGSFIRSQSPKMTAKPKKLQALEEDILGPVMQRRQQSSSGGAKPRSPSPVPALNLVSAGISSSPLPTQAVPAAPPAPAHTPKASERQRGSAAQMIRKTSSAGKGAGYAESVGPMPPANSSGTLPSPRKFMPPLPVGPDGLPILRTGSRNQDRPGSRNSRTASYSSYGAVSESMSKMESAQPTSTSPLRISSKNNMGTFHGEGPLPDKQSKESFIRSESRDALEGGGAQKATDGIPNSSIAGSSHVVVTSMSPNTVTSTPIDNNTMADSEPSTPGGPGGSKPLAVERSVLQFRVPFTNEGVGILLKKKKRRGDGGVTGAVSVVIKGFKELPGGKVSPAKTAGLLENDELVKINEVDISTPEEAVYALKHALNGGADIVVRR